VEILNKLNKNERYKEANVLVVSKTKMGNNHTCIGAISDKGLYMRLLSFDSSNMLKDVEINIHDNLHIKYKKRGDVKPPHNEDINLYFAKKISTNSRPILKVLNILGTNIWEGAPSVLFDAKLKWSQSQWSSKGYISKDDIPNQSVGFWIADRDLYLNDNRYEYISNNSTCSIKYVGISKPQECIYKGTLIRVSLARWWDNHGAFEDERCYLQLSECYPLEEETNLLEKINSSINSKTAIKINYFVNGKNQIYDDTAPYKVLNLSGNYFLACEVKTEYKFTIFRITKIRSIVKSSKKFTHNQNMLSFANSIQTPFAKYSEKWEENMIKVKVEIDKSKAMYFEIKNYLPSQKIIERKENGNIIVSFKATQEREIEELIKKWLPFIKVIEPISLDEKIKVDIKKYLDLR
jgi:hypothetical protein